MARSTQNLSLLSFGKCKHPRYLQIKVEGIPITPESSLKSISPPELELFLGRISTRQDPAVYFLLYLVLHSLDVVCRSDLFLSRAKLHSMYGCICAVCLSVLVLTDTWIASSLELLNIYEHPCARVFLLLLFFAYYLFGWFVCVCMCASARVNSENSLGESVLFYRVGPGTQTQVVRLGGQEGVVKNKQTNKDG